MIMDCFFAFLVILCIFEIHAVEITTASSSCLSTQYYDSTVFQCLSCDEDMIPDTSIVDVLGNYIQCKCASGSEAISNDCSDVSIVFLIDKLE